MAVRRALGLLLGTALLLGGTPRVLAVSEPPPEPIRLGLYEWMGTASMVIAADVLADDGKFVQAITRAPIKGELPQGTVVLVDLKKANRDRAVGTKALDLVKGHGYLLLLEPSPRKTREPSAIYDLVRGMAGARELPNEASAAMIEAASRLAAIQERKNDGLLWSTVPDLLEDPNPVLVDAALELVLKFRRESVQMLPVVEPLIESPRPEVRQRAVLLVGRILHRDTTGEIPERSVLVAEITGRARRDDDVEVRRTATSAIAALRDPGIDETLKTISREDPDQNVRFEAEKALYERRLTRSAGSTD